MKYFIPSLKSYDTFRKETPIGVVRCTRQTPVSVEKAHSIGYLSGGIVQRENRPWQARCSHEDCKTVC